MDATLSMTSLAVAIGAGVVVFAVSIRVLRQHSLFGGPTAVTVALCMSALTALALLRHVPLPAQVGVRRPVQSLSMRPSRARPSLRNAP